MEPTHESIMMKVIFTNEPRLSEHAVQQKLNERRLNLVSHIREYLSTCALFKNKKVSVTFADTGVASLVSIIEADGEKLVLKIPLILHGSSGEAEFLKVWEQAGVKVPHVFADGVINGHQYCLMEYIDAPRLNEVYSQEEFAEKGIHFEMGQTLRKMHKPEAVGYGSPVAGKAEFSKFNDWLMSDDIQERISYVSENNILGGEHGSISKALEVLRLHVGNNKSSYCHDDFGATNIFATHPITVFDPNPRFNSAYIDLGRSLVFGISGGMFPAQLVYGYFEDEPYDEKVLHASILLNSYNKLSYWHKTKKYPQIENIQKYLTENKHLLGD